jgi:hypothetical protein
MLMEVWRSIRNALNTEFFFLGRFLESQASRDHYICLAVLDPINLARRYGRCWLFSFQIYNGDRVKAKPTAGNLEIFSQKFI